ncbi:MAG: hypothetical protein WDO13_19555 [Verrucomicrobiota bacterium]
MTLVLILAANFFVLIICLVGVQSCYFRARWNWFWLMLMCVLMSGGTVGVVLYTLLAPAPPPEMPLVIRSPTTPL